MSEGSCSWGPTAREWGGFLADTIAVPWADHMLCPPPPGIDLIAASGVSDNVTDAWRAGLTRALGAGHVV